MGSARYVRGAVLLFPSIPDVTLRNVLIAVASWASLKQWIQKFLPPPPCKRELTMHPKRAKAPLPLSLPGEFCVLMYDRDLARFQLVVDDVETSSHDLGPNIPEVMRIMHRYAGEDVGNRVIDIAKEFGMAQYIFLDQRVIPIHPPAKPRKLKFEESSDGSKFVHI